MLQTLEEDIITIFWGVTLEAKRIPDCILFLP
jgi:hypothetical protein